MLRSTFGIHDVSPRKSKGYSIYSISFQKVRLREELVLLATLGGFVHVGIVHDGETTSESCHGGKGNLRHMIHADKVDQSASSVRYVADAL